MNTRRISGFFGVCLAAALALGAAGPARADDDDSRVPPKDKAAFERLIREYLLENPDVIIDALNVHRERREVLAGARRGAVLAELAEDVRADPMLPQAGAPDGDITLIEFFDYRCGYCKRAFADVQTLIKTDGRIRYALKEFPILGPQSEAASRFALAVWMTDPERYTAFRDALMVQQGALPAGKVRAIAAEAGVDTARAEAAMDDPKITAAVRRTHEQAAALGINGTPSFVIGGEVFSGVLSLQDMRAVIAQKRGG